MNTYRAIWWGLSAPLALVGSVIAFVVVPLGALASLVSTAVVIGGGLSWMLICARSTASPRACLPKAAAVAAVSGALVLIMAGLIYLLGPIAMVLVPVLTVTAQPVVRQLSQWAPVEQLLRSYTHRSGGPADAAIRAAAAPLPPQMPVNWAALTDTELCRGWRISFVALQNATSVTDRLRLARERQGYLDEMERRAPQGFAKWFDRGARAGSDPSKFLSTTKPPPPTTR